MYFGLFTCTLFFYLCILTLYVVYVKGKVVGFFDSWPAKRKFPVDMAGFAINVQLLFKYPYATMPYKAGFEEDRFLSALSIRLDDIEPKAQNCTRVCKHTCKYHQCSMRNERIYI